MPTNPRSIILDDLQAVENYMYNLNGTHLLDLQPPPELDVVEQQKWVQKQSRYRPRKNNTMANSCGRTYRCVADGTSQINNMQKDHEGGNQFLNVTQNHCKRKTPPSETTTIEGGKKG